MAGSLGGMMEHALAGTVHRFWINGALAGEIAASAGVAGALGVPLVCVTSDQAGVDETAAILPATATYATKSGYGRFMGRLRHPSETVKGIEEAARDGCSRHKSIAPYAISAPVTIRTEFHKVEEADMAATLIGVTRIDGYTVEFTKGDFLEAHAAAYNVFSMANRGRSSD